MRKVRVTVRDLDRTGKRNTMGVFILGDSLTYINRSIHERWRLYQKVSEGGVIVVDSPMGSFCNFITNKKVLQSIMFSDHIVFHI